MNGETPGSTTKGRVYLCAKACESIRGILAALRIGNSLDDRPGCFVTYGPYSYIETLGLTVLVISTFWD